MINIEATTTDGYVGKIEAKGLRETIEGTFDVWSLEEYQRQWHKASGAALRGEDVCFVVNWDPDEDPEGISGTVWFLYHLADGRMVLQNSLILNEEHGGHSPEDPMSIHPGIHETIDEDGYKISEWEVDRELMERFCQNSGC